jgi:hypothetical protein
MKNILALILLFSINGYGQPYSYRFDEQMMSRAWGITQNSPFDSAFIQRIKVLYRDNDSVYKFAPVLDTVRVVIQYSDTTGYVDYWFEPNGKYDSVSGLIFGKEMSKKVLNNHWPIYGGYAYSVREAVECPENIGSTNLVMHMFRHVEYFNRGYLDENKRPLSKNIIVWQDKEVK